MATKRRKNRIVRKIATAVSSGNLKKADNKTQTLNRIATREGNRAVGNTALGNAVRNVVSKFNPRVNLTASARNFSPAPAPLQSLKPTSLQNTPTRIREQATQIAESYVPNTQQNTRQLNRLLNEASQGTEYSPAIQQANFSPVPKSAYTSGGSRGYSASSPTGEVLGEQTVGSVVEKRKINNTPTMSASSASPSIATASRMSSTGSTSPITSTTTKSMGGLLVRPDGSESPYGNFDYSLSAEEKALKEARKREADYYEAQSREKLNRDQIMRDTLRQFQGEIDATNAVFADRLKQSQLQGQDRLGMSRAENFNAGAVNSSFGNAAQDRVLTLNRQEQDAIYNEKLQLLSQIENQARELGNKYYEDRRAAKEGGLESYISSISSAKEMKDSIATDIAFSLLDSEIDVEDVSPKKLKEIASQAGVSVQNIKKFYKEALKAQEAEALKAEQEAQQLAIDSQFNLSEGQARYDQFGNLIASRAKTYAPKSGGAGSVSSVSEGAKALALQIRNGQATLANVPSAMRAEVAQALNELPNQQVTELDNVLSIIDELENNSKLGKILGPVDQVVGGVFGEAATAKNLFKQLEGVLALEGRSKLKGSGAISDFEFTVLKDAQSALKRNLNEVEFKKQLTKVRDILENRRDTISGGYQPVQTTQTLEDYRMEFPQATDEELQALMMEEQGI